MILAEAIEAVEEILEPLAVEALADVVELVRAVAGHPDGAAVAARRSLEALAAKAFIAS